MNYNQISDKEFKLVNCEMQKYRQLKKTLRSRFVKKPSASPQPDIEKIRAQIHQELTKKLVDSS